MLTIQTTTAIPLRRGGSHLDCFLTPSSFYIVLQAGAKPRDRVGPHPHSRVVGQMPAGLPSAGPGEREQAATRSCQTRVALLRQLEPPLSHKHVSRSSDNYPTREYVPHESRDELDVLHALRRSGSWSRTKWSECVHVSPRRGEKCTYFLS